MWAKLAESGQPGASSVGTTSTGRASHAIRGTWNYGGTNRAACGKELNSVQHLDSGRPLAITCKACVRTVAFLSTQVG